MKDKKDENIFKKLSKDPKGQAVLFFGGYVFFFLFLMIVSRVMGSGIASSDEYDKPKGYSFSVTSVTGKNYAFNHKVVLDGKETSYVGGRYGDKEKFVLNNEFGSYDYYRDGFDFYNNSSGVWLKSDNPYIESDFFDITNIMGLIESAKLDYKTDYESGKKIYNFIITSTTINNYFTDIDLDIADDINEIVVNVDEDGFLNAVEFKLNSYCKAVNICSSDLNINLEYENYGEIEEITNPLD